MPRKLNLTGNRFGELTVITEVKRGGNRSHWLCHCNCEKETIVKGSVLKSGHTKSCGCLKTKRQDLKGQRFGKLTAISSVINDGQNRSMWKCVCNCGNEVIVRIDSLSRGNTQSCGCSQKEKAKTTGRNAMLGRHGKDHPTYKHGLTGTKIYKNQAASKRRLKTEQQTPQNIDLEKILSIHKLCSFMNSRGNGKYEIDHIQPLSRGGLHHENNLQILLKTLNAEKNAKWPLNEEERIRYTGVTLSGMEKKGDYIDLSK